MKNIGTITFANGNTVNLFVKATNLGARYYYESRNYTSMTPRMMPISRDRVATANYAAPADLDTVN